MKLRQSEALSADKPPEGAISAWPPAARDTEETLRAVRRIARALALSSRDLARQHGLTATQLLCLRLLKEHRALSSGALAKALSLSPQTATGLLDRLEVRGLIERIRSTSDRRCVLINLTGAGEHLIETTGPMLQDRFVARFNDLSANRQRSLRRALEAIVVLLEADALDAAPVLAPGHLIEPGGKEGTGPRPSNFPKSASANG